jgi:hypothetical protein
VRLFGFEIKRAEDDVERQNPSFAEPINDDGALNLGTAVGGSYGMLWDIEGTAKSEAELVTRYRGMMLNPEIQQAVDEIVNEAISIGTHDEVVQVVLDDTGLPDRVKDKVTEEFERVLELLDFSNQAYEIFSKFYVDGRLNYHVIIDEKDLRKGIVELRYLDPRKVRLIREMDDKPIPGQGSQAPALKRVRKEYYMYSESGFGTSSSTNFTTSIAGLRIAKDSIVRVTSGILNESNTVVLSHLHRAIKSLNQLRMLEDATVIYTITRAPERRIFYVDVGNLPKAKAEQYLHDMMARHKNRVTYDPSTGEVRDDRKMMTMTEDYWFPRREGNRSTEVETLAAGSGLGEERNLPYFQSKLYKALNVPVARLQPETMYSFGRSSEITREEIKFSKFVRRLRARFSIIFDRCLEKQLVLKGVMSPEDWSQIRNKIRYDFMKDNFFEEMKQTEILREKLNTLSEIEPLVGKYFSREWVVKNVLFMTEDEMRDMQKQIDKERSQGYYDDGSEGGEQDGESAPEDGQIAVPQDDQPSQVQQLKQSAGNPSSQEGLTIINTNKLKPQRRVSR